MEDGRIKLYFTWRALAVRERFDAVFRFGQYVPLRASGTSQLDSVCAFARSHEGTDVLIAVGRWFARLRGTEGLPRGEIWQDTRIDVPREGTWINVLTGESVTADATAAQPSLALAQVFATLPWALLVPA